MGAVTDIKAWIDDYQKLYVLIDNFIKDPAYVHFTKADSFEGIPQLAPMMRSWKGRVGTFKETKWGIDKLSDSDIDSAKLVVSKDFFDKVAGTTKADLDVALTRNYIIQGLDYIKIAYGYSEASARISGYNARVFHDLAQSVAIGGISMVLMALHPYHLFCHFAWHSTNTYKHKDPDTIIADYYQFFTETQWDQLNKYINLTVKSKTIINSLESLSNLGGKRIDTITNDIEFNAIRDHFTKSNNSRAAVKIIGTNAAKLFIDTYTAN